VSRPVYVAEPLAAPPLPRGFLIQLALPALALSAAITVVSAYAPVLLSRLASPAVAGALIGAEGLFALLVPVLIGARSDRTRSRFGSRLPYLAIGAGLAALGLAAIALGDTLALVAAGLAVFYLGYFVAYAPYRALYPDCVGAAEQPRALGIQSALREVGLGAGLVGGGLIFAVWGPLPFLLGAALLLVVVGGFVLRVRDPALGESPELAPLDSMAARPGAWRASLAIVRRRADVRRLLAANALWELAQAALKSFAVLFLTVGLGRPASFAPIVFAVVAVSAIGAALLGARLSARFGLRPLVLVSVLVYGTGALLPAFSQGLAVAASVPLLAFAAALVMSLSFAWLSRLAVDEDHGLVSGLFGLSQGAGIVLGPLLAGAAVVLLEPSFSATEGYGAIFLVAGGAVLASLALALRVPDAPEVPAAA
jgi:Na+/melibiose symporter-like transporter